MLRFCTTMRTLLLLCLIAASVLLWRACGDTRPESGPMPSGQKDQHKHGVEALERGRLFQRDNGLWAWSYYDVSEPDSSYDVLEAQGFQGGGPSWVGIIHGLVALRAPERHGDIDMDDESDGLVVTSRNQEALRVVARLVAEAKRDPALLDAAIKRAQADGEME